MRKVIGLGLFAVAIAAGGFVLRPQPLAHDALAGLTGDPDRGRYVFVASGCSSCHVGQDTAPDVMAGGRRFQSEFGTFVAPNISSDATHGVGAWTDLELASAIMAGVGRDGAHLYPSLPYTAYAKADRADIVDLIAYMRTLPASDRPNEPHEIGFPFNQRVLIGGWKFLYADTDWALDVADPQLVRGRYLVEALGHCGECHTPRDALGGLDHARWMAGAPNPSGDGRIPNITPAVLDWSTEEIVAYLASGFTPDFNVAGGSMTAVIRNTEQLERTDLEAIAAYLKAVPPVPNAP